MDSMNPPATRLLDDCELADVTGGRSTLMRRGDKCYRYIGKVEGDGWRRDWDASYLCPNCGRPVHYGSWFRYYCDPCRQSWSNEEKLALNLSSGLWEEIGATQYEQAQESAGGASPR